MKAVMSQVPQLRVPEDANATPSCARGNNSSRRMLRREVGSVWLGGLDSNQDNQIQNLMYCQLYDLPAGGNKKGRLRDPGYTLLSAPQFVNQGVRAKSDCLSPQLGFGVIRGKKPKKICNRYFRRMVASLAKRADHDSQTFGVAAPCIWDENTNGPGRPEPLAYSRFTEAGS